VALLARAIHAANGGTARYKKPLSATQWSLAFDGFAVSAAVCDMMPFTTAMAHKAGSCFTLRLVCVCVACMLCQFTCEKVGQMAKAKGKPQWISTIYDEVGQMVSGMSCGVRRVCLLFRLCGASGANALLETTARLTSPRRPCR